MTFIVLSAAPPGTNVEGYDLRIGPLLLQCPLDQVAEQLGDGLSQVGAALTPAERRPRPLNLKLPVRGYFREIDPVAVGRQQRRQVRQLLNNARWTSQGLYWTWDVDSDLDGWLLTGGGELAESDPGITFAEFELTLNDTFLVAKPGTHRMARRLDLADRRGGAVPRDTRGLIYSTDFNAVALPTEPLQIPGDVLSITGSQNKAPASTSAGAAGPSSRFLWRNVAASPGEVVSYMPDLVLLPSRRRAPLDLDNLGAVRVWDMNTQAAPDPATYTGERDRDPDAYYDWERVLGDPLLADTRLAMDNGWSRVIWLGSQPSQGLAIEYWDATLGCMRRQGRVLASNNVLENTVVEVTPERAVLEFRAGDKALRCILQRGWTGPRLEAYNDSGGTARIEYAPTAGTPTLGSTTPTWVDTITAGGRVDLWARGTAADVRGTTMTVLDTPGVVWTRTRAVVGQFSHPGGDNAALVAGRSLCDHQAVPTLVARRQG